MKPSIQHIAIAVRDIEQAKQLYSCAWWTFSSTTSPQDLAHEDVRQARAC